MTILYFRKNETYSLGDISGVRYITDRCTTLCSYINEYYMSMRRVIVERIDTWPHRKKVDEKYVT